MHELDWLADIQCIAHHLTLEDRASEPIRTAQLSTLLGSPEPCTSNQLLLILASCCSVLLLVCIQQSPTVAQEPERHSLVPLPQQTIVPGKHILTCLESTSHSRTMCVGVGRVGRLIVARHLCVWGGGVTRWIMAVVLARGMMLTCMFYFHH
jgi:hypothetical protein